MDFEGFVLVIFSNIWSMSNPLRAVLLSLPEIMWSLIDRQAVLDQTS